MPGTVDSLMKGGLEKKGHIRCKSILVIEDDNDIRETLKALLETEGYPVATAANGKEGLQLLSSLPPPCLILLDLMMPEMNGWEFMQVKRQSDLIASIPVVIISAAAAQESDKRIPQDINGYIKKPIDLELLLEKIALYCRDTAVKPSAA